MDNNADPRDEMVVFHGCVPSDAAGNFTSHSVDGVPRSGKALFDAFRMPNSLLGDQVSSESEALRHSARAQLT